VAHDVKQQLLSGFVCVGLWLVGRANDICWSQLMMRSVMPGACGDDELTLLPHTSLKASKDNEERQVMMLTQKPLDHTAA